MELKQKERLQKNNFRLREMFISGKLFVTIHLRKKLVKNFRNSGSGLNNIRIYIIIIKIWLIRCHIFDFNRISLKMQYDCGNGIIDAGILKIKIANSEPRGPPKFCT